MYFFLIVCFKLQIEADTGFLIIYDGGSEQAEMIGNLSGTMNHTNISTPRNQIFVVLHTNKENNASVKLNAMIIQSE